MTVSLPIYGILPQIKAALIQSNTLLLQASPGAGKSTVVPVELLNEPYLNNLKIILLEPRRLAARAVAEQLAARLNERVGQTVGYSIRHDTKTSANTRLLVVTEGILSRMLLDNPFLEEVGLLIFDEFHERNLQGDFAFALARNLQQSLRDELRLLLMSATLPSGEIISALNNPPFLQTDSRSYPINYFYQAPNNPNAPIWEQMTPLILRAYKEQPEKDILCFLPGAFEIEKEAQVLAPLIPNAIVLPLYGDLPIDKQRQVIEPNNKGNRKVILATSIAETSITINGVTTVVDSGLARVPFFDSNSGFTRLITQAVSMDSAVQRAGRAGRTAPGTCYRLWTEAYNQQLQPFREPEILAADLAPLVLDLAAIGSLNLPFITPPPPKAFAQAIQLLQLLGAIDTNSKLTELGAEIQKLGIHPRLGKMLLAGKKRKMGALACAIAALLEEKDPFKDNKAIDFTLRVEAFVRAFNSRSQGFWVSISKNYEAYCQRLEISNALTNGFTSTDIGALLALAFPDRVAQRKEGKMPLYKLANRHLAKVHFSDDLSDCPYLAIASLDGKAGESQVYLAAPVELSELKTSAVWKEKIAWKFNEDRLITQSELKWGDLTLQTKPLERISFDRVFPILKEAILSEKGRLIRLDNEGKQTLARIQSLHHWNGEPFPNISESIFWENIDAWLPFYGNGLKSLTDFENLPYSEIIESFLSWELKQDLNKLAPTCLRVPTGSQIPLQYSTNGQPPILAVRLQEVFGMIQTPKINEGKIGVILHLLSPGFKPVQITSDLHSFWTNTYTEVRKELRMRYPKHSWPENPWNAEPVKGALKRPKT